MAEAAKTDGEARIAAALAPFGWTCTSDFWQRYYDDAWVFNLANAVQLLSEHLTEVLQSASEGASDA